MGSILLRLSEEEEKQLRDFMIEEGCRTKTSFFHLLFNFYKHNRVPEMRRFKNAMRDLTQIVERLKKVDPASFVSGRDGGENTNVPYEQSEEYKERIQKMKDELGID